MGPAWTGKTSVSLGRASIAPKSISQRGTAVERVFFIPAQRAMFIGDGWAAPFQKLTPEVPVVARLFSQHLFDAFTQMKADAIFPNDRGLDKVYRALIDDAVFHGGTLGLRRKDHAKRLELTHGDFHLPFLVWTAGQREFTPLLLGLYHLLPARKVNKQPDIDWVIVEEPEMGLHPQAVSVFMLLCLDLLWRGYKVVLATHSPLVLTVAWMLRRLQEAKARWQLVLEGFGIAKDAQLALKKVAEAALEKEIRAYVLAFDKDGLVRSKDISSLDPGDEDDDVSGWGGLAAFSSHFGDAVRKAAIEAET